MLAEELVAIKIICWRDVQSVSELMVGMFKMKYMLLDEESPMKSTKSFTVLMKDEEQESRRRCHNKDHQASGDRAAVHRDGDQEQEHTISHHIGDHQDSAGCVLVVEGGVL